MASRRDGDFARLERAIALYDAYLDSGSERPDVEEFLDAHPDVRDLLEPMLARTASEGGDPSLSDFTFELDDGDGSLESDAFAPGASVGPYHIVRRLGAGGFGVVYLARQETPIRREVAIKVVKRGMDTEQIVARFAWERQALALMNHPGVATVHDAGATEDGRPYFIMEYVDGVPITEYAREHGLDLHARIQLFSTLCDAVQHAHQRGVLHRDLKPSNILVAERDGISTVRVIDFGIAKALLPGPDPSGTLTGAAQAIGTPDYMSPEQVNAEADIDTRSDVYALGVIFYELITGILPFDPLALRRGGLEMLRKVKLEETPRRPSTRVVEDEEVDEPSAAWRSALRGDLDAITMKALERERGDRYGSAAAFAEDLERWRTELPVMARPPLFGYVASRFVSRHRRALSGATAAVAIILVLAVYAFVRIEAARRAAETERSQKDEQWRRAEKNAERFRIANARVEFQFGRLAAQRGRWREALDAYDRAEQAGYGEPIPLAIARVEALEGGQQIRELEDVLRDLASRTDLGRHEGQVRLLEGDLLVNRLANPDDGLDKVQAALSSKLLGKADESYASALLAHRVEDACACCRSALQHDPYHRRANEMMGLLLLATGRFEELRGFAPTFRAIYPEDPSGVMMELAVHCLDGREDLASALIESRKGCDGREVLRHYAALQEGMDLLDELKVIGRTSHAPLGAAELFGLITTVPSKISKVKALRRYAKRMAIAPALIHAYLPLERVFAKRGVLAFMRYKAGTKSAADILAAYESFCERSDDALFLNLVGTSLHEIASGEKDAATQKATRLRAIEFLQRAVKAPSVIPGARTVACYSQLAYESSRILGLAGPVTGSEKDEARKRVRETVTIVEELEPPQEGERIGFLILACMSAHDDQRAAELGARWLRTKPDSARALGLSALAYARLNQYGIAEGFAARALAIDPKETFALKARRAIARGKKK